MKTRKILSLVLCAAMMMQLCLPVGAVMTDEPIAAACTHHTRHTATCGYAEGTPCAHEHTAECYEQTLNCTLAEGEASPDGEVPHEHSEACYTTQTVCKHTHDAVCGYTEGVVCSFNPATCPECNPVVPETPEAPEVPEEPVVPEIPAVPETIDTFASNHDISSGGLYLSSAHCVKGCEGHIVTGSTTNNLIMVGSGTHNITLRGVSIDKSAVSESCAFEISGGARVRLTLEGANTLKSGYYTPGLEVAAGSGLTITQESTGSLTATGGTYAAGIGGRQYSGGGTIGILGGTVTAYGGYEGAGIGGGYDGASGCYITIGGGKINATGGDYGAGIGGSYDGNGKTENYIAITGGNVTARAGAGGAIYGAAAGIGGGYKDQSTNNINISGGTVDASGGSGWSSFGGGGAGIGGGQSQDGGNIRISGGAISAKGGYECAGIGGGESGAGGDIHISGGTITAYGGSDGAGIGSGYRGDGGSITINGDAFIFATKGKDGNHDIGLGRYGDEGSVTRARGIVFEGGATQGTLYGSITLPANFTVPLGTVLCIPVGNTLTVPDGITLTLDGYLSVLGTLTEQSGSTILNRENIVDRFMSMVSAGNVVINSCGTSCSGHILAGTTIQNTVTVTGGTHDIWLYSVNIQIRSNSKDVSSFALSGDANVRLTLSGSNTLKSGAADYAGLQVPLGTTLTILKASTGRLDATGTSNAAGIGGSEKVDAGTIVIQGGTITANGGRYGAGIGDGHRFAGSKIEIQGGTVIANGGQYGAGIGSGGAALMEGGDGGCNVTISGGKIIATGGDYCAGIGGTRNNSSGKTNNITITGGDVTAKAGAGGLNYGSAAGIGGGHGDWAVNNINITGGTISATGGSGWGASGGGGAGIGGGQSQSGGTINLSNAVITAQGGRWGAGIGGGQNGAGGSINITGGTITATGGENAAGIGGGQNGGGGTVKFDENTVVFATRGGTDAAHIGAGASGAAGSVSRNGGIIFEGDSGVFYGSNVTLKENATLPSGKNLTIASGKTLTIPAGRTFTNNANLFLDGGSIAGEGTVAGSGSFKTTLGAPDIQPIPEQAYTGKAMEPPVTINPTRNILGKDFTVTTEGFAKSYADNIEMGAAKVIYTKGSLRAEKIFTITKAETTLEGAKTYKVMPGYPPVFVEANNFTYGGTIGVKATPKATGTAPGSKVNGVLTAPITNQMALYLGDTQISDAVDPDKDGVYTMIYKTADKKLPVGHSTITAKYVSNDTLADGAIDLPVTLEPNPVHGDVSEGQNRVYNGSTKFADVDVTLKEVIEGDVVSAKATGSTTSADVGTHALNPTAITLSGKDSRYYIASPASVNSANIQITQKFVTVDISAANKVYDGTDKAKAAYTVVGTVGTDYITATGTATFADKNVGAGKTVTAADIKLVGEKAGNYTLGSNTAATAKANITPKPLSWGASGTVQDITYGDSYIAKIATAPTLLGIVSGDNVTITKGEVQFTSVEAGIHPIKVTGFGIEKITSKNYTAPIGQPTFANGTIHPKPITPDVVINGTYTFNGKQQRPDSNFNIVVKDGSTKISPYDYTVTYGANINAGLGSVIIEMKGNYKGNATQPFTIGKASITSPANPEPILMTANTEYSIPLPEIGNAGDVVYSVGTPTGDEIFADKPEIKGKNLEFTSASGASAEQTAAVEITIKSTNYNDFKVTIPFGVTGKTTVVLTGLKSATGLVYDGASQVGYTGTISTGAVDVVDLVYTYTGINGTTYNSSTAPKNAGNYKLLVAIKSDNPNYTGSHVDIVFTIAPKPVTVTQGTYTITKPWDGTIGVGTPDGTLQIDGILPKDSTVTVTAVPQDYPAANVGTYDVEVDLELTGANGDNYILKDTTVTVKGTITQSSNEYTGTQATAPEATPEAVSETYIAIKPVTVAGQTVEYAKSTTNAAPIDGWQDSTEFTDLNHATEYYFFARVKANDSHTAGKTSTGTPISTAKKTSPLIAPKSMVFPVGRVWESDFTVAELLGEWESLEGSPLPTDAKFSKITAPSIQNILDSIEIEGGKLAFMSKNNPKVAEDVDVFFITVSFDAYQDVIFPLTFRNTDKLPAIITATLDGKVYDGKAMELPQITATVNGLAYEYKWMQGEEDLGEAPMKAGEYRLEITGTNESYEGSLSLPFIIGKRPLTITANSESIIAGAAAPSYGYTQKGLVADEKLTDVTLTCSYTTSASTGNYPITPAGGTVSGGNDNYAITYVPGTLAVTLEGAVLDKAIADAKAAKSGVTSSDLNPNQVQNGQKFVPTQVMTAFEAALASAEQTKAGATTNGQIAAAAAALAEATGTFTVAIRTGTYISSGGGGNGGSSKPKPEKPSADKFTDITNHWAAESIRFVVAEGLFNGTGETTFAPDRSMDRAMFATVLGRMAKADLSKYAAPKFADVPDTAYYAGSVAWAAEQGIVTGTGEGSFSPERPISRQELVVMLHRYAKLAGMDVSIGENTNILSYGDAVDVSQWAIPAMQWACGAGVLQGADSSLLPNKTATRAEVATILQRFVALTADADKLK